jgi:hypothetical protein
MRLAIGQQEAEVTKMQVRHPIQATRVRSPLAVLGMLAALLVGTSGYGLASATITGRASGSVSATYATPDPMFAVT